jgi:hypothetical protein
MAVSTSSSITVQIEFVTEKSIRVNVADRRDALATLRMIASGATFVGWPDSDTPILINPAHVTHAAIVP